MFFKKGLKLFILGAGIFLLFLLSSYGTASAATYYWVGNSDNSGVTSVNTNWNTSAVACGTTGNKIAAFTTSDILNFTSTCTSNAAIDANLSIATFTMSAGYSGAVTQNAGITLTASTAFSQAAGTFNGSAAAISLGSFTQTGGTFNSTSGTLTITRDGTVWTHVSGQGTFVPGSGTVSFGNGTGAVNPTINATGETFYNLTLNELTNINFLTVTGTITVNGTLLNTKGYIKTGTVNAKGPVTFASACGGVVASASIVANGTTAAQVVTFGGGTSWVPNITINNASATVVYNGTTTFASLTLTAFSGTFDLGVYPLTMSGTGAFSQAGGTFNGGTATMTVGSFTLTGGTFNSTSGTLAIGSNGTNFTHVAGQGTFNPGSGTVSFTGGAFNNIINATGETFNNLTVNLSSTNNTVTVTGTITVNGTLTYLRGLITSGIVQAKGPVVFTSGASVVGTATLLVNGSGAQSVTFGAGSFVGKLTINNASATVVYNGASTLASLDIANGTFALGGNNITVASNFIVGPSGNFKRYGNETITTTPPSFSAGSTATYNGTAASYTLPNYTYTNAHVIIDAPSADTVYNLAANLSSTDLTVASGVLNQRSYSITNSDTITIASTGSWMGTSTGAVTIGTGGVSNAGSISLISPTSILIRSTVTGAQRPWVGLGYYGMTGVDVKDQGGTSPITVYGGIHSGNNDVNWYFSDIPTSPDRIWKGQTSALWSVASNWFEGSVPASTSNAIFSASYKNPATFDANATSPANVIINSGYTSTVTLAKNMSLTAFTQRAGTFNASSYNFTTTGNLSQTAGTFSGGSGVIDIGGNLTVSGGTFTPSTATTSVFGNFDSTGGTISASAGTIDFDGGSQTITGTTTFYSLNKVVSSAANLIFGAGQTFTVMGTTTLHGSSGQLLTIKSSSTPAQWMFDPQGGLDLAYVTVKDSNNISSSTTGLYPTISANNYVGITDGTNNTNWTFTLPTITISATGTQATSTPLPASTYMGGAFQAVSNIGINSITSISLTQSGSLSTSQISSVKIYYKESAAGICYAGTVFPAGTTLFGTGTVWSQNKVTLNGTMSVGTNPVCLYVIFDLTGTVSFANLFFDVDLQIIDPVNDITSDQVTVLPSTPVDITGVTMIVGGSSGYPTISFSAASTSVSTVSGSTTLSWSTGYYPHTCTASGDNGTGGEWITGTSLNTTSGSALTGALTAHRSYVFTITCTNNIGSTVASVSVVATNPNAPILTFSANPTSVASGTASRLTWTLGGGPINVPTSCLASNAWSGNPAVDGGTYDTPALTSNKIYTLACGNSFGTTTRSVGVSVIGEPAEPDTCGPDYYWVIRGTPCTTGGGGGVGGEIGDAFSLTMEDESINPTVFYFWNNGANTSLYMRQGADGPDQIVKKLTADGLNITAGNFTGLNCVSGSTKCNGVKIHIDLEKRGIDGSLQNYTIEKTFKTTVNSRTNNN